LLWCGDGSKHKENNPQAFPEIISFTKKVNGEAKDQRERINRLTTASELITSRASQT